MWVKILYFLRIFRQTGFFIKMLVQVIDVSRIFFLIYLVILSTFGCVEYILSDKEHKFPYFINANYLLGLGEFETEWDSYKAPETMQIFFLIATLMISIVMLNLLIAIVSTAYEDVIVTQQESNDFERVNLIAQNSEFIPRAVYEQKCNKQEYLIKACIADGAGDEDKSEDQEI